MKKILLAFDSFKETFSSIEISEIVKEELSKKYQCQFIISPMADGGEGTLECLHYYGLIEYKVFEVQGPNNELIEAKVGYFKRTPEVAIIESAEVVGFKNKKDYSKANNTTTYGIGQLINKVTKDGIKTLYISLGGTITNDGGCGMLSALGVEFYNKENKKFIPTGSTLKDIKEISTKNLEKLSLEIFLLSDVDNKLLGNDGATYTYAKQKGASLQELEEMELGMEIYSKLTSEICLNKTNQQGGGAAGGLGFGLMSYFNATSISGIDFMIRASNLKEKIEISDLIITGEGKLDNQSLHGKLISGILKEATSFNKDVILLVGKNDGVLTDEYNVKKIYEINKENKSFGEIKENKVEYLIKTINEMEI